MRGSPRRAWASLLRPFGRPGGAKRRRLAGVSSVRLRVSATLWFHSESSVRFCFVHNQKNTLAAAVTITFAMASGISTFQPSRMSWS